jgi:hypothetical protein
MQHAETKLAGTRVKLLTRIREILFTNIGRVISYNNRGFSQSLQTYSKVLPRLSHDLFLPNPFQFIIYHSIIRRYSLDAESAVKLPTKKDLLFMYSWGYLFFNVGTWLGDQGSQAMSHSRPMHARRKDSVVLVLHGQVQACCSPYSEISCGPRLMVSLSRYLMEVLRKTLKILSHDSRRPGWWSKWVPLNTSLMHYWYVSLFGVRRSLRLLCNWCGTWAHL